MREVSQNSYDKRALKNGFIVTGIKTFYTNLLIYILHMVHTNVDKWSLEYSSFSCWTDVQIRLTREKVQNSFIIE